MINIDQKKSRQFRHFPEIWEINEGQINTNRGKPSVPSAQTHFPPKLDHKKVFSSATKFARCALLAAPPCPPSMFS